MNLSFSLLSHLLKKRKTCMRRNVPLLATHSISQNILTSRAHFMKTSQRYMFSTTQKKIEKRNH